MKKNILLITVIIFLGIVGGIFLRQVDYSLITSCTIFPSAPSNDYTTWYTFFFYTKKILFVLSFIQLILTLILITNKLHKNYMFTIQCLYFVIIAIVFSLIIYGSVFSFSDNYLKITYTLINLIYFQCPIISALLYLPLICTIKRRNTN